MRRIHTDLHYREGAINNEFPFLLGHEAAGTVSQVGSGVSNLNEGDFVILVGAPFVVNVEAVCEADLNTVPLLTTHQK